MAMTPAERIALAKKVGIGAGATLAVGLTYFLLFYGDVTNAIDVQKKQEQALRNELAEARQSEFAYHQDLAELTLRQQRQRELNKVLPETTEYPSFLSAIQGVANVAGVSLQGWTPQEEVPAQFFARVPMRLALAGRFHQIAKFFYGVGQLDRIINIENISLKEPRLAGDDINLKVDCLATAFHILATPPPGQRPQGAKK
jgi:type IV pilus assembly protein PilO